MFFDRALVAEVAGDAGGLFPFFFVGVILGKEHSGVVHTGHRTNLVDGVLQALVRGLSAVGHRVRITERRWM